MTEPIINGGWNAYQKLVLGQLEELHKDVSELRAEIRNLQLQEIRALWIEIATLKVKSGLWGAAAGFVPAALVIAYMVIQL